jgi:hypothetical protein
MHRVFSGDRHQVLVPLGRPDGGPRHQRRQKGNPHRAVVSVTPLMHAAAGCFAASSVSGATRCGIAHLIAVFAAHVVQLECDTVVFAVL